MVLQESAELRDLGLATDEAREPHRETLLPSHPPRRGEVELETRNDELCQVLRNIQILQAMMPKILEGEAEREIPLDQRTGRLAEQHLTPMCGGGDPGATMDIDADVPLDAPATLARVQPHADPNRLTIRPVRSGQGSLRRRGSAGGAGRAREDHEQSVSGGVDLDAPLVGDSGPDQPPMPVEDLRIVVGMPLEHPRGTLDVREEERHGSRGEVGRFVRRRGARNRTTHGRTLRPGPSRVQLLLIALQPDDRVCTRTPEARP